MSQRRSVWTWSRQAVQIGCLLLFFGLFFHARLHADSELSPWAKLFFWIDPLVLIATWLAAHAVPLVATAALATVAVTLVFGRVFCGWVCPLGTLHAAAGWVFDRVWPNRKHRDHWSPWQRAKYYVLAAFLAMAVLGGHWVCVFDPLVFLVRSLTVAVQPGVQWAVDETSLAVYRADPHVGDAHLTAVTEPTRDYLRRHVFNVDSQTFFGAGLILVIFTAALLANAYRRRFWCRYVCPLGALLGVFAWRPLLRRKVVKESCTGCDLCCRSCHGASAREPGAGWKSAECFVCNNCADECPRQILTFNLLPPLRKEPRVESVDLSKRALGASVLSGVAALWMLRSTPLSSPVRGGEQPRGLVFHPQLIRPPGSRPEREFLQRCLACGLCMKVCPTGGLQPAISEAGLEGLWTPRLVPRIGHCDFECTLCGHVCPTEAIRPLDVPEKQKTKIGLAFFDVTRCIPYAYSRDCMVCEEHCPIADKAIYSLEVEVRNHDGKKQTIRQPHVDPDRCIGCGICENVCPLLDGSGIRVASANESRHPKNQPILPATGDAY